MKISITILLLLPIFLFAQKDTLLTFHKVVLVDSVTKTQLFERARHWFNDYFNSSKAVLQINDKESGELTGKPTLTTWFNYRFFGKDHKQELEMPCTVRILVKDGKYKVEMYNIVTHQKIIDAGSKEMFGPLTSSELSPIPMPMINQKKVNIMWNEVKLNAAIEFENLSESLNTYMHNSSMKSNDDF